MITQIHVEPADHPTDLCALLGKYGSDKSNFEDTARHNYGRYYAALFRPIREQVTRVFELGIFGGASLRAWRDYFPNATVYGADIDPGLVAAAAGERIVTWQCDETSLADVASMWTSHRLDRCARPDGSQMDHRFDVIIDDALHTLADNIQFFKWSYQMLRSGGLYIVEDIPARDVDGAKEWAVVLRAEGWAAHLLVIPRVVNGEDVPDNNLLIMRAP